ARLAQPAGRADRRVQPVVRPARPRPPDERFSQDGGDTDERAAQGGHRQAIPGRVRKIGVVNTKNKVLTAIAATLMDGPAALRHYVIDNFIVEGFTFEQVM